MTGSAPPKVLVHPSFLRLEEELASRILALTGSGAAQHPILVAAPSDRMVRRIRESLADRLGAVIGVECLHYQALAYRVLGGGSRGRMLSTASAPLLETLVETLLAREPDSPLTRYGRSRPGAVRALTRLLSELREAGLGSNALDSGPPAITSLLRAYDDAMGSLAEPGAPGDAGWGDRSEIFRRAAEHAGELPPFRAVFAYGAYELVGINLDLLRALPSREGIHYLIPADPDAPAWAYARTFIERHLEAPIEVLPDSGPDIFVDAARSLWSPEAPDPLPEGKLTWIDVQGPEAELTVAARLALSWIETGVPPWEIGIVARTLDPYRALAETVFERHQLPVDASLSLPLSRHPAIRAFLLLVRILGRDFERQPVIELVRSPLFRKPELSEEEGRGWRPGAWDQWSRAYGITRGVESWTEMLPQLLESQNPRPWIESDSGELERFESRRSAEAASARLLGGVIDRLAKEREAWDRCGSGDDHRAFLRELGERWIRGLDKEGVKDPRDGEVATAWLAVLDEIAGLQGIRNAVRTPGNQEVREVLEFVERSLEESQLPWKNPNGVSFLDFRQARGLSYRHLVVIGCNDGWLPNPSRELPFLTDDVREGLRARTGKPLPLKREAPMEERLLFAQAVTAARDSLTILWQRADAEGKVRAPSPYSREIRRWLPQPPGAALVSVPTHPARNAMWLGNRTGLLTREEAVILAAEAGRTDPVNGVARVLGSLDPELTTALGPSLEMIRRIERFQTDDLAYDGWVETGDTGGRAFSASSLKMLGNCPQTFFFRYVLGVKPLREVNRAYRLDARELGTHVHALLEAVYSDLRDQGHLDGHADRKTLTAAGRAALEKHWESLIAPLGRRLRQQFPLLFQTTQEFWRDETERFLEKDLIRIAEAGHSDFSFETSWNRVIPGDEGEPLSFTGIADRVCRSEAEGWLISDYKTGGNLEKWIEAPKMLRLNQVQLPLYVVLAEAQGKTDADAEALGLGPSFMPDRGFVRTDPVVLEHEKFRDLKDSFLESLTILGNMARNGKFPFRSGFHCTWCEFAGACRKNHYPSRKRVETDPRYRDYFLVQKKSSKAKSIDDLRESS